MDLNHIAAEHLQLAATGMTVVFAALALIVAFICLLPHVLTATEKVVPSAPTQLPTGDEEDEIAAAIGFALHHHETQSVR